MKIRVPYETAEERGVVLELEVPDANLTNQFIPKEPAAVPDLARAVENAIDKPVAGLGFREAVKKGNKVVLIVENQFRAAPVDGVLPLLIKRIRDAGAEARVVIANGKVPALSQEEIAHRVGKQVVDAGITISCNDASNPDRYSFVGVTTAGTPLWILKEVREADVVITISTTQATLWGYGGSGMVIPGVASNETIETNHVMALAPDCRPGNNECRLQQDKYEALRMAGIRMAINLIVSNRWDVVHVNAGIPVESHKAAVEFYDRIYGFRIGGMKEKADIVITGSSAPTDHLFFHTNWAIVNCLPVSKEGATIIMATPCPGYGSWPGFALMDLMAEYMPPTAANHERVLRDFFLRKRELWAGCIWYPLYKAMMTRTVKVVTQEKNHTDARKAGIDISPSLQDALAEAMKKHGPKARVAFVPFGRYSVFHE